MIHEIHKEIVYLILRVPLVYVSGLVWRDKYG